MLITLEYPPDIGGIAVYLKHLSQVLGKENLSILAPPLKSENENSTDYDNCFRRELIGSRWLWPKWLPVFFYTLEIAFKIRPTHLIVSHILPVGTVAWLVKKIFSIPYVVICHGMDLKQAKIHKRHFKLAKKILKDAQAIIANSNFTASLLAEFNADKNKIEIIYPCPNLIGRELPHKLQIEKQNERIILTVGRLVKRKGIDVLIKAFADLLKDDDGQLNKVNLKIIGNGPERAFLERLSRELGLNERVTFLGKISDDELASWLSRSYIFALTPRVLPGDVEGFGTVYLEASLFGVPSIVSKSGGVAEAVLDNETGLLVKPGNTEEIKNALKKLLFDENLREQFGRAAQKRVAREFNPQNQFKKIFRVLS